MKHIQFSVPDIQQTECDEVFEMKKHLFHASDNKYQQLFDRIIVMAELGVRLYFAVESDRNRKITTKEDLEMFQVFVVMHLIELI